MPQAVSNTEVNFHYKFMEYEWESEWMKLSDLGYGPLWLQFQFYESQFSCSVVSDPLWPHELQHARPPCLSPTPRVHPNSCPSSQWCHPAISASVVPFSFCPQSLPASGSFPVLGTIRLNYCKFVPRNQASLTHWKIHFLFHHRNHLGQGSWDQSVGSFACQVQNNSKGVGCFLFLSRWGT